jgi:hypothetical protein
MRDVGYIDDKTFWRYVLYGNSFIFDTTVETSRAFLVLERE